MHPAPSTRPAAPAAGFVLLVGVLVLGLAGCGGGTSLPAGVADDLAAHARAAADAAADSDDCVAMEQVAALRSTAEAAREDGSLDAATADRILTTAGDVEAELACEAEPAGRSDEEDEGDEEDEDTADGADDGNGKPDDRPGKGKGRGKDD